MIENIKNHYFSYKIKVILRSTVHLKLLSSTIVNKNKNLYKYHKLSD